MITKQEIIDVLLDYGVSPIEIERVTHSKKEFECAIQSLWEDVDNHAKKTDVGTIEFFKAKIAKLAKKKGWSDDLAWLQLGLYKEVGELIQAIEKKKSQKEKGQEYADVMHFLLQLMNKIAPKINLNIALMDKIHSNEKHKKKTYSKGKIIRK